MLDESIDLFSSESCDQSSSGFHELLKHGVKLLTFGRKISGENPSDKEKQPMAYAILIQRAIILKMYLIFSSCRTSEALF
jgi:hypothetical protein